jgi:hypothetical protein
LGWESNMEELFAMVDTLYTDQEDLAGIQHVNGRLNCIRHDVLYQRQMARGRIGWGGLIEPWRGAGYPLSRGRRGTLGPQTPSGLHSNISYSPALLHIPMIRRTAQRPSTPLLLLVVPDFLLLISFSLRRTAKFDTSLGLRISND